MPVRGDMYPICRSLIPRLDIDDTEARHGTTDIQSRYNTRLHDKEQLFLDNFGSASMDRILYILVHSDAGLPTEIKDIFSPSTGGEADVNEPSAVIAIITMELHYSAGPSCP